MSLPVTDERSFYLLGYSEEVGARLGAAGKGLIESFNNSMKAFCNRGDLPEVRITIEPGTAAYFTVQPPHTHTVKTSYPDVLVRSLARLSNLPSPAIQG